MCQCREGFIGNQCQIPICFGQSGSSACHGQGTCVNKDTCICKESSYTGRECEQLLCYGLSELDDQVCSGYGRCTGANKCSCFDGYTGDRCESRNILYMIIGITVGLFLQLFQVLSSTSCTRSIPNKGRF